MSGAATVDILKRWFLVLSTQHAQDWLMRGFASLLVFTFVKNGIAGFEVDPAKRNSQDTACFLEGRSPNESAASGE